MLPGSLQALGTRVGVVRNLALEVDQLSNSHSLRQADSPYWIIYCLLCEKSKKPQICILSDRTVLWSFLYPVTIAVLTTYWTQPLKLARTVLFDTITFGLLFPSWKKVSHITCEIFTWYSQQFCKINQSGCGHLQCQH